MMTNGNSKKDSPYCFPTEGKPGTPVRRLSFLLNNLYQRFPNAISLISSAPHEPAYIKAIDDEREAKNKALNAAITALNDWTNTYAPEFCNEERVKEANNRLNEKGTLYYIASVVEQCKKALE